MVGDGLANLPTAAAAHRADNAHIAGSAISEIVATKLPLRAGTRRSALGTKPRVTAAFPKGIVKIGVTTETLRAPGRHVEGITLRLHRRRFFVGAFGLDVGPPRAPARRIAPAPGRPAAFGAT